MRLPVFLVPLLALLPLSRAATNDGLLTAAQAENSALVDFPELFGYSPRANLSFTELVEYDGYDSESHYVTTSDGYILALYRIPLKDSCPDDADKVPIIFNHGLYLSGDDCIIPGPGKAHCYIYADNCYDVWIPNNRGNRYSRNHTTMNPDTDPEFWNFSMDDMASKDLPVIIDYVLEKTGKEQITYVAHSQAVATLILLCAEQPEYNAKIKVGFGLSATAWLDHARFIAIPIQAGVAIALDGANNSTNAEFVPYGGLVQTGGNILCGLSTVEYPVCSLILFAALGYNKYQITPEVLKVLPGHMPAGTSLKDFIRWGQIRKNGFTKYDYGLVGNIKAYRAIKPPAFDLSPVTMKWIFLASTNDYVGDPRDIKRLTNVLSNAEMCILKDQYFGHLDFLYADNLAKYITPKVLSYLKSGTYECDTDIQRRSDRRISRILRYRGPECVYI